MGFKKRTGGVFGTATGYVLAPEEPGRRSRRHGPEQPTGSRTDKLPETTGVTVALVVGQEVVFSWEGLGRGSSSALCAPTVPFPTLPSTTEPCVGLCAAVTEPLHIARIRLGTRILAGESASRGPGTNRARKLVQTTVIQRGN